MKRLTIIVAGACFICALALGQGRDDRGRARDQGAVVEEGLHLTAIADRQEYLPSEPILVRLVLTNRSSQRKVIAGAGPGSLFEMKCYDEDGNVVPLTRFGVQRPGACGQLRPRGFEPGETCVVTITLNRWFDMSMDGKYRATFARLVRYDGGERIVSNDINVSVRTGSQQY